MRHTRDVELDAGIRAGRLTLAFAIVAGTAVVALHDWLGLGGSALDFAAEGPIYDSVVVAAGLSCLLRALSATRERGAWIAIGVGILCWGASEVYWTATILNDPSPPYPSLADVGYLAFYPLAGLGIAMLVRARAQDLDWRLWMDGVIAGLGTAALGASFIFDFVAGQTEGTPLQIATTLAYPLGDIAMLSLIVGVIALTRWRPGRAWSLLLAGLAVLAAADILYTLQSTDLSIPEGPWVDPLYMIAAGCLAAGAWQSDAIAIKPSARFDGWRELMVPALFFGVMIGLFAMQYFSATSGLSTILWATTMIAVIVRLGISVRENKLLIQQVRTDPLTGLASRGALQMDLPRIEEATAEDPVYVVLFDLDKFKRYNDTFGHPAGDELLATLGRGLREAVGADGTAYRIGGDEFCLLLECERADFDAVARRAAMALTGSQGSVTVASSWGAVTVPDEETTAHDALQLADLRMYAQKESRRLARDKAERPPTAAEAPLGSRVEA